MRKITQEAIEAFNNHENFKKGNTQVKMEVGIQGAISINLLLHDRVIARKRQIVKPFHETHGDWMLEVSNGAYPISRTTKERLNGIDGVHVYTRNHIHYINGREWNGEWRQV